MRACFSNDAQSAFVTQTGIVLLLCLIFMTALTLLGISASTDTMLQQRLAANLQDTERAKQSALSALEWAESWLLELEAPAPENCVRPCRGLTIHRPGDLPLHPEFENSSWWLRHGYEAGVNPLNGIQTTNFSSDNITTPVWIIETAHTIPPVKNGTGDLQVWYRILARGANQTNTVVSVIESTVVRSWPMAVKQEPLNPNLSLRCPGSEAAAVCGRVSWRELR